MNKIKNVHTLHKISIHYAYLIIYIFCYVNFRNFIF